MAQFEILLVDLRPRLASNDGIMSPRKRSQISAKVAKARRGKKRRNRLMCKVCSAFCLIFAPTLIAQSITVDPSIPANVRPRVQHAATDAYSTVLQMFRHKPPLDLPIVIYSERPITTLDNWHNPSTIRIGVASPSWSSDQLIFQISHELGHVMLNPRRNNGFVDTICTALSLVLLKELAVEWGDDLIKYEVNYEQEATFALPLDLRRFLLVKDWESVASYLRVHTDDLEPSPDPKYRLAAAALLLLSKPVNWSDFAGIAGCTFPPPEIAPDFSVLPILPACLSQVKELACRIEYHCPR